MADIFPVFAPRIKGANSKVSVVAVDVTILSSFASGIEGFGPHPGVSFNPTKPRLGNRQPLRITAGRLISTATVFTS
ncbi:MAG: hypothetical protein LBG65_02535 [Puniceicoccales bacterium]|nr:hypothetical protein [Puniceicoccales bacterium]